jgi:hypothetical protein
VDSLGRRVKQYARVQDSNSIEPETFGICQINPTSSVKLICAKKVKEVRFSNSLLFYFFESASAVASLPTHPGIRGDAYYHLKPLIKVLPYWSPPLLSLSLARNASYRNAL